MFAMVRGERLPPGGVGPSTSPRVAAVGHLPLVVLFDDDRGDEAVDGGVVGEDAADVAATLDLTVQALERVRRPQLPPVLEGEGAERQEVLPCGPHDPSVRGDDLVLKTAPPGPHPAAHESSSGPFPEAVITPHCRRNSIREARGDVEKGRKVLDAPPLGIDEQMPPHQLEVEPSL